MESSNFGSRSGLTCCPELGGYAGCIAEGRDPARSQPPSAGPGAATPCDLPFPYPSVGAGASWVSSLPPSVLYGDNSKDRSCPLSPPVSAPIIASTHGLLSNPHKAPQAVLGAVWLLEMGIHTVLLNANDCMGCWGQNMSERGLIHGEVLVGRHLSSRGKAQPEGTERSV